MTSARSEVAEEYSQLARFFSAPGPGTGHAERLVAAAVRLIDGCDHAALSRLRSGRMTTAAATDDVAMAVDELQIATGEGPCLDALVEPAWEHAVNLAQVENASTFQRRVIAETPVRSILAFRILDDGRKTGALNIIADRPGSFDDRSFEQAAVFASFAGTALAAIEAAEQARQLQDGLLSNREIGIAIGILMSYHRVGADDAFAILRRTSQQTNRKLRDVAADVLRAADPQAQRPRP